MAAPGLVAGVLETYRGCGTGKNAQMSFLLRLDLLTDLTFPQYGGVWKAFTAAICRLQRHRAHGIRNAAF